MEMGFPATATPLLSAPACATANSPLAGHRSQQGPVLVSTGKSWRCLVILFLSSERARAEVPQQGGSRAKIWEVGYGQEFCRAIGCSEQLYPQILSIFSHFIYGN